MKLNITINITMKLNNALQNELQYHATQYHATNYTWGLGPGVWAHDGTQIRRQPSKIFFPEKKNFPKNFFSKKLLYPKTFFFQKILNNTSLREHVYRNA